MKYFTFFLSFFLFSSCSFLPQQPLENIPLPTEEKETITDFTPQQKEFLQKEEKQAQELQTYTISRVIDGDTIYVIVNGKERKIRIMGIDTPEKEGGFRTAECFGDDASIFAKEFLKGKRVALLQSKIGDTEDKYGRWLRYVFVDGRDFGALLIAQGYAESYKRFPHDRKKYYNELEKKSQKQKNGMWNPDNCLFWGQEN